MQMRQLLPEEEKAVRLMTEAFPSLAREMHLERVASGESKMLDHAKCVEARRHLPRLVPQGVLEWLPIVLFDLTMHRETCREELGELGIYFLNPISSPPTDNDLIVDRFADAYLTQHEKDRLKELMAEPPWPPGLNEMSNLEQRERMNASRENSFSLLNDHQERAVLTWLLSLRQWDCFTKFCPVDLANAIDYWEKKVAKHVRRT